MALSIKFLDKIRSEGYIAGERCLPREHNHAFLRFSGVEILEDCRLKAEADFLKSHSANSSLAKFITWLVITSLVVSVMLVINKAMDLIFSFV